jgi:FkbH-like protein
MELSVFSSFEPALLQRALSHWNDLVPLFSAVVVHSPSRLGWGLRSEVARGELRVLALDGAGRALVTADGVPHALHPNAPGLSPIVVLCPDSPIGGAADTSAVGGTRGDWIDGLAVARASGVVQVFDLESDRVAGVPYTDAFYLVLATSIFRRAHARLRPEVKVIAVDCDGTLWRGLCAEDGPDGLSIGPEELALQTCLVAQQRAGRIVALVSKNVLTDVEAVFARRGDLALTLADVAAVRVGWEPKASTLRRLAHELGLGLDSFLFIDDSAAECAMVSAALPDVAVLQRPMTGVQSVLDAMWPLDLGSNLPGALGAERTLLYRGEEQRRAAMTTASSLTEYVVSLELRVELRAATTDDEGRVFELFQRTNQFNTADDRPSIAAVHEAVATGRVVVARVRDRFGDYGLCGVAVVADGADALRVERLLLSCRVLGRGVEEEVFDGLVALATERGYGALEIAITATPRNLPARDFIEWISGCAGAKVGDDGSHRFALHGLLRWRRQFDRASPEATAERSSQESRRPDWIAPDWNMAAELTSRPEVLGLALGLGRAGDTDAGDVLGVVGDVLGRPVVRGDNLYAVGADSLRIARIVARLHSNLGVEVSIAEVMHRGDVDDLIALVERGARPPEDDEAFLAQLGSLYDEDEPTR